MKLLFISIPVLLIMIGCNTIENGRKEINLNGTWDLARTDTITELPREFERYTFVHSSEENSVYAYVDEDFEELSKYKWFCLDTRQGYAVRYITKKFKL